MPLLSDNGHNTGVFGDYRGRQEDFNCGRILFLSLILVTDSWKTVLKQPEIPPFTNKQPTISTPKVTYLRIMKIRDERF